MKILFVSTAPLEYGSSSNMRNIALLKGFIENNHEVCTLTPEPQKDSALYDDTICDIKITQKYFIPFSTVHSAVTIKKNKKSIIKKFIFSVAKKLKIYDFRSSLANKTIKIEEKFDIVISSSDPKSSHLVAEKLIKNNPGITKKWIQYWGDPFADDINNKGYIPKCFIKREEKRILGLADYVLYVSPFTLKKQQKLYSEYSNKMLFLPIPYNKPIIYKKSKNKKIKIGYFGDYYSRNRSIMALYNTIKNRKEELIICGNSDLQLEEYPNIKLMPRVSLEEVRKQEENSDILVCICNKKGTQIPGKIYHYSATNKPIMILLDGDRQKDLKTYFTSFNRFIICRNEEKDIVRALNEFKKANNEYSPLNKLNPKNLVQELLEKINNAK